MDVRDLSHRYVAYHYNCLILLLTMSLPNGPIENDDDQQQVLLTKANGLGFIEPLTTLAEEFPHSPGHQRKIRLMAEKVRGCTAGDKVSVIIITSWSGEGNTLA